MRTRKLSRFGARASEGVDIFAIAVVLIDEAGTISIADIEVAVGCDGQIRGTVFDGLTVGVGLILFGFLGIADGEDLFAIQRGFHHHGALRVAKVEELLTALHADMETVRSSLELPAPGLDNLAFRIEDDHRVGTLAR